MNGDTDGKHVIDLRCTIQQANNGYAVRAYVNGQPLSNDYSWFATSEEAHTVAALYLEFLKSESERHVKRMHDNLRRMHDEAKRDRPWETSTPSISPSQPIQEQP